MICANCGKSASHIITSPEGERCEHCGNFSAVSKHRTDGILTRTSYRVRRQQSRHEGDIVRPHVYDKAARRERVNPDFVRLYPDKVKDFFSSDELKRDGYRDMPGKIAQNEARRAKQKAKFEQDTTFSGNEQQAMERFLK